MEWKQNNYNHDLLKVDMTDARGRTALHYASQSGAVGCMQALMELKADPNLKDQRGSTAILLLGGRYLTRKRRRNARYTFLEVHKLIDANVCSTLCYLIDTL